MSLMGIQPFSFLRIIDSYLRPKKKLSATGNHKYLSLKNVNIACERPQCCPPTAVTTVPIVSHDAHGTANPHLPPPSHSLYPPLLRGERACGGVEGLRVWPADSLPGLAQRGRGTRGHRDPPRSAAMPPSGRPQRRRQGGRAGPWGDPPPVPNHTGCSLSGCARAILPWRVLSYVGFSLSTAFLFFNIENAAVEANIVSESKIGAHGCFMPTIGLFPVFPVASG